MPRLLNLHAWEQPLKIRVIDKHFLENEIGLIEKFFVLLLVNVTFVIIGLIFL